MADEKSQLALTAEERKKILAFLRERAPDLRCPACGGQKHTLAEHLVSPVIVNPAGGVTLGGVNYPMVLVFCDRCLKASFFAAVPMGILRTEKKPERDGPDG